MFFFWGGFLLADLIGKLFLGTNLSDSVVICLLKSFSCATVLALGQCLLTRADYICKYHARHTVIYFLSLLIYLLHHLKFIVLCFDPGWGTKGTAPTCWVCIAGLFLLQKVTTYATDVLTVLCSHNHIVWFGTVQKLEVRGWMSFSIICSARSCKNHVILRACLLNIWSLKIYDFQTFLKFCLFVILILNLNFRYMPLNRIS